MPCILPPFQAPSPTPQSQPGAGRAALFIHRYKDQVPGAPSALGRPWHGQSDRGGSSLSSHCVQTAQALHTGDLAELSQQPREAGSIGPCLRSQGLNCFWLQSPDFIVTHSLGLSPGAHPDGKTFFSEERGNTSGVQPKVNMGEPTRTTSMSPRREQKVGTRNPFLSQTPPGQIHRSRAPNSRLRGVH